ncbi:methyl-accepting chemotaxis protein [Virgisporangium aliadipatigenens]|uniref:Methyl-accepting chemotaxis protein n=1 Tax=Virgisporangium aliadipatigenens TaxID=741659 RepID=A0A8J3YR88_9ACTN|nr:methyl-accepting chemotaxis protein [Virgisporangium aliadipatigenens]GIJ49981.1 methyl-accepting chemotaxis protein [Virgisporangium aliadipatigenens]
MTTHDDTARRAMGLRERLLASFALVLMIIVVLGGFAVNRMASLNESASEVYAQGTVPLSAIQRLEITFGTYTTNSAASAIPGQPPAVHATMVKQATEAFTSMGQQLDAAEKLPMTATSLAALERVRADYTKFGQIMADTAAQQARGAAGDPNVGQTLNQLSLDIAAALTEAGESEQQAAKTHADEAAAAYESARMSTFAMLAIGVVLSMTLALLTARSLLRPLHRAIDVLDRVADGDLRVRVPVSGGRELAQMGAAVNRSLDSIADVLRLVTGSATQLADASQRLTTVAGEVSRSVDHTVEQANVASSAAGSVSRNVTTVAAGAEEMTASIREISQNAAAAVQVSADAMAVAAQTTETVSKLGDSSAEIGNVIRVITAIAEQTNLLALNATIESARAGDAGKGFAVVAGEVKELAQETAKATEDISRRITSIQADTSGAVEAISRISEVINKMNDYQTTIASAVEEQTSTTNEIGRNVSDAADGSQRIATNISQVAEAGRATTERIKEAQDAADELARMSTELQQAVGRFHA